MSAITVERLLGGPGVVLRKARAQAATPVEWIEIIRRGLPARSIEAVAKAVELTQAELSETLAIPERTLIRRKKEGTLSNDESAKLVRLARIVQRATEVFGDHAGALDWLKSKNRALGQVTPLSLLDTDIGAETVMDTLGRIEHGVFA